MGTGPADTQSRVPDEEEVEVDEMFEALRPRLQQFVRHLAAHGPAAQAEAASMREMGAFWRSARRQQGLGRRAVAERMGVSAGDLAAFESGYVHYRDLPDDFLVRLANAIEQSEALNIFIARYGHAAMAEPANVGRKPR
jgi:hypothetical protein